ncbi:MAG TPA: HdeD family acid-resistance protein [Desulfomonilaceae bacterium]|nr:HdeD family acid-resistance protein [Desulfomonilaceae bacterium]
MAGDNQMVGVDFTNVLGDLQKNWGWFLALGILFVILGFIGLGMMVALTIVSVLFLGIFLLIGAGAQIVDAFKCKGWKSVVWHILTAVLYAIAGLIIIVDPLVASIILTFVLGFAILVAGIMRIIIAFHVRGLKGWVWPIIGGIISILLGILIIAQWPLSGLWIIGLFVAIEMIVSGWSYIFVALGARHAGKTTSPPAQSSEATAV